VAISVQSYPIINFPLCCRYLIDSKWFKNFKHCVGMDDAGDTTGDTDDHPGPIDNSPLFNGMYFHLCYYLFVHELCDVNCDTNTLFKCFIYFICTVDGLVLTVQLLCSHRGYGCSQCLTDGMI
jgi:hypothetical protein